MARFSGENLVTSSPKIRMVPLVKDKVPAIVLKRVDFPAPFPPKIVIKSCSKISKETSFKIIFSSSKPFLTTLVAFFNSTIAVICLIWLLSRLFA